jgi:hypothetical protein
VYDSDDEPNNMKDLSGRYRYNTDEVYDKKGLKYSRVSSMSRQSYHQKSVYLSKNMQLAKGEEIVY